MSFPPDRERSMAARTAPRQAKYRDRPITDTNESRLLLRLRHLHRLAGFLPFAKSALDVGDGLEPHALRGLGRERRTPAAGAEEHELLVLRKDRLVIGACRIDPEFQHAARAGEGARHLALALAFARIADIDEGYVVAAVQPGGLLDAQGLDLALRRVEQRAKSRGDRLRHAIAPAIPAS